MIYNYLPKDKVETVDPTAAGEENKSDSEEDKLLSQIGAIEGIDVKAGIKAAGDKEVYLSVARNFYDTAVMRMDMIKSYYESEDIENYTIQVHALKSSARLLGAADLSEAALALEMAGKEGNLDTIKKDTGNVLSEYGRFKEALSGVFGGDEEDDRPEISEKELKANLTDMHELLDAFDYDTAKDLLESMEEYKVPAQFKEIYDKIKTGMAEVDRDRVMDLIKEII